ncbi:MAG TPA: glutathione S-transferase family protein [Aeromonadales bacterium]|nr:glutathione S-transferase family protein [Aeromonadales bacterium]
MKLYGMGKSRSIRALWALEEAQLKYEYISVEFGSDQQNGALSEQYRCLNSQGKVPTLVDDELVLTESGAIVNYVAAKSANRTLIPTEIESRAKYDELCYFILSELEQGLWTNGKHRFALPEAQRVPEVLATATWEFAKAQKALACLFDGKGYAASDHFTMADILLAHTIGWADSFNFEVAEKFLAYKNRMYQRPAFARVLSVIEPE